MRIAEGPDGLAGAWFPDRSHCPAEAASWRQRRTDLLASAESQIRAYLAGQLRQFDLPLGSSGTVFQRRVWRLVRAIPYAQRMTYGEIARALDKPSAARAVGMAVGRNPWSLIVPCHRVVGSGGALTGYAGGMERKRWLLSMEAAH